MKILDSYLWRVRARRKLDESLAFRPALSALCNFLRNIKLREMAERNVFYVSGYFGKYLNKYGGKHVPAGWDEWVGLKGNSKFYNYTLNVNGNRD